MKHVVAVFDFMIFFQVCFNEHHHLFILKILKKVSKKMARGDKRKRNIKRDWTSISIKSSNGAGAGAGGKQSSMMIPTMSNSSNMMIAGASNSTLQQGMSIAKSNQKNTLPNLKMVGKKMQKKIEKLKVGSFVVFEFLIFFLECKNEWYRWCCNGVRRVNQ